MQLGHLMSHGSKASQEGQMLASFDLQAGS